MSKKNKNEDDKKGGLDLATISKVGLGVFLGMVIIDKAVKNTIKELEREIKREEEKAREQDWDWD